MFARGVGGWRSRCEGYGTRLRAHAPNPRMHRPQRREDSNSKQCINHRFPPLKTDCRLRIVPFGTIGSHTYHGWFIGGGTEIALAGLFGLPLPTGLFWRSEYRYSSFSSANLPVLDLGGVQIGTATENMKPIVQTITTSLVWKFNWGGPI